MVGVAAAEVGVVGGPEVNGDRNGVYRRIFSLGQPGQSGGGNQREVPGLLPILDPDEVEADRATGDIAKLFKDLLLGGAELRRKQTGLQLGNSRLRIEGLQLKATIESLNAEQLAAGKKLQGVLGETAQAGINLNTAQGSLQEIALRIRSNEELALAAIQAREAEEALYAIKRPEYDALIQKLGEAGATLEATTNSLRTIGEAKSALEGEIDLLKNDKKAKLGEIADLTNRLEALKTDEQRAREATASAQAEQNLAVENLVAKKSETEREVAEYRAKLLENVEPALKAEVKRRKAQIEAFGPVIAQLNKRVGELKAQIAEFRKAEDDLNIRNTTALANLATARGLEDVELKRARTTAEGIVAAARLKAKQIERETQGKADGKATERVARVNAELERRLAEARDQLEKLKAQVQSSNSATAVVSTPSIEAAAVDVVKLTAELQKRAGALEAVVTSAAGRVDALEQSLKLRTLVHQELAKQGLVTVEGAPTATKFSHLYSAFRGVVKEVVPFVTAAFIGLAGTTATVRALTPNIPEPTPATMLGRLEIRYKHNGSLSWIADLAESVRVCGLTSLAGGLVFGFGNLAFRKTRLAQQLVADAKEMSKAMRDEMNETRGQFAEAHRAFSDWDFLPSAPSKSTSGGYGRANTGVAGDPEREPDPEAQDRA